MKLKKFNIESQDMYAIINALDFYSRIWIGQYNEILSTIRWYRDCRQLDSINEGLKYHLMRIRYILLPDIIGYGFYGSYGIFNPEVDYKAGIAYDMQQVFRNKLAYFENPEGGITVNFNPPMHCGNDPYDFPKAECYMENDKTYIEIEINDEHLKIIKDALQIKNYAINGNIDKMFEFYTNDANALEIAGFVTDMFTKVDLDKNIKYKDTELIVLDKLKM